MREATNINGLPSTDWMKCTKCKTFVDTYIPLPHQYMMHKDPTRYIGAFGGYGSGKTKFSTKDDEKHIFITKGGETLVGAKTIPQIDATIKKDFEMDMPVDFVRHYAKQKNTITFKNSHKFYYKPLNDEGNLRSMNVSRAHFLEASVADHDKYVQATSRLRNENAMIPERDEDGNIIYEPNPENPGTMRPKIKYDWRKFIIESNPDSGWIRDDVLLKSGKIHVFGDTSQEYHVLPENAQPQKASYVIPTNANFMLPSDFIPELKAGRPEWWIRRYLYGSFDYAEGLVYPEALKTFRSPIEIPKHWKRIIAMDYGLRDNTHFVFLAIDPDRLKVIAYDELVLSGMNINTISRIYKDHINRYLPVGALMRTPVMDGRSFSLRQKTGELKTMGQLFLDEGLLFDPAQMDLHARIMRTNTLIESGKLEIIQSKCPALCDELLNYKFPERSLDVSKQNDDKPQDVRNHGINALEFAIMEVPHGFETGMIGTYDRYGKVSAYANERMARQGKRHANPLAPQYTNYNNDYGQPMDNFEDLFEY